MAVGDTLNPRPASWAAALVISAAFQLCPIHEGRCEAYSAADMLSRCQELLASAKRTADPDAVEMDNSFSTGSCWGAFLSIQQLVTLKKKGARKTLLRVCVPENVTLIQFIQVYDLYARRHPERENEPFTIVALSAAGEAFPCK
jgi:Rap1a immunity proteins